MDTIFEKTQDPSPIKYYIKYLPDARSSSYEECWNILNSHNFNRGEFYSLAYINCDGYRAWRVTFETYESHVQCYVDRIPRPGFIPSYSRYNKNIFCSYMNNIVPPEFHPCNVGLMKFYDNRRRLAKLWTVDLRQIRPVRNTEEALQETEGNSDTSTDVSFIHNDNGNFYNSEIVSLKRNHAQEIEIAERKQKIHKPISLTEFHDFGRVSDLDDGEEGNGNEETISTERDGHEQQRKIVHHRERNGLLPICAGQNTHTVGDKLEAAANSATTISRKRRLSSGQHATRKKCARKVAAGGVSRNTQTVKDNFEVPATTATTTSRKRPLSSGQDVEKYTRFARKAKCVKNYL